MARRPRWRGRTGVCALLALAAWARSGRSFVWGFWAGKRLGSDAGSGVSLRVVPASLQEACAEAQKLEAQLERVVQAGERQVSWLDTVLTDQDPRLPNIPRPLAKSPKAGGGGSTCSRSKEEDGSKCDGCDSAAVPGNTMKNPPILSFECMRKAELKGACSEVELPQRRYPAELRAAAGDHSLDEVESRHCHEALEASLMRLEELWPRAEAAREAVLAAEARALARRPAELTKFRERVQQYLLQAFSGEDDWTTADIEASIKVLEEEATLLRHLAKLEEGVIEVEGCTNEYKAWQAELPKLTPTSEDYLKRARQIGLMKERIEMLNVDLRTICDTARTLREGQTLAKEVGDFFGALNPFR
eukprot:TRINITY_DN91415_c0_g1_i1.p1 TRINITY_DN91415_c0_g1~~TRINITY_DN91415_c0_g1_i1.p1  ORF type:complete len:373 (-),score=74.74 TRINITY_DN91415_c0_g1_i1:138-1217(-)